MKRSLRSWLWRVPLDEEVDEELALHVELRTRELIARGMDPAAARDMALSRLGDVAHLKRTCVDIGRKRDREMWLTQRLEELRDDVKVAMRQLKASPAFTFVAALTLALGIGANAAVFGVIKSVLIDPLPYADADRLVRVYGRRADGSQERGPLSAGTFTDIAERQSSFDGLAPFVDLATQAVYGSDQGPQMASVAWVGPRFFDVLGISAFRGRTFRDDEAGSGLVLLSGQGDDTASAVLLAHGAWQRLFGGDPQAIGRRVRINGVERTVVGVLPREFVGPAGAADFYLAFDLAPVAGDAIVLRGSQWLGVIGRLKQERTHEAARREMEAIGTDLAREYPRDNGALGVTAMPLRDALVGDTRTPLLVLMASAALVLLITCANLAGALLSRTLSRRKEFAVRTALGAGHGRLVRQLLTETTVLACAGGAAGLLLAAFLLDSLRTLALPTLPAYADISLDTEAVFIITLVALCTGLVFGVAPAVSAAHSNSQGALRHESRGLSESRRSTQLRGALVAGQMALCISLLVGAGLLARSLWAMTTGPLGFDPNGVLTAGVQLPARTYATQESRVRFFEQLTDSLRAIPGVEDVAAATDAPTAVRQRMGIRIEGVPTRTNAQPLVLAALVSDNYFRTLRIPILRGRTFDARDRIGAPPTVVISESAARGLWAERDALGAHIRLGPNPNAPLVEVIGIVGDVRNDRARPDAEPMVYAPTRRVSPPGAQMLLRTDGDPLALTRLVERELAALDPNLALQRPTTLAAVAGTGLAGRRLPVLLMTGFGALALLLASVGVYAMFASMASAREREFGIRMALGSHPRAIAGLVLRQGTGWMAAGLGVGALGIVLVVRLVSDLLYEVQPFDPITLGASAAILVACATVALLIPVHRATRVDPVIALREQ